MAYLIQNSSAFEEVTVIKNVSDERKVNQDDRKPPGPAELIRKLSGSSRPTGRKMSDVLPDPGQMMRKISSGSSQSGQMMRKLSSGSSQPARMIRKLSVALRKSSKGSELDIPAKDRCASPAAQRSLASDLSIHPPGR